MSNHFIQNVVPVLAITSLSPSAFSFSSPQTAAAMSWNCIYLSNFFKWFWRGSLSLCPNVLCLNGVLVLFPKLLLRKHIPVLALWRASWHTAILGSPGRASAGVLYQVLGSSVEERPGAPGAGPARATEMTVGLDLLYQGGGRKLGLFSVKKRLIGELINVYKYLKGVVPRGWIQALLGAVNQRD